MSRENHDHLGTADLVAGSERQELPPQQHQPMQQQDRMGEPRQQLQQPRRDPAVDPRMQEHRETPAIERGPRGMQPPQAEQLAALFPPEMAQQFRNRWDQVQIGFVDDPNQAVRQADELVAQVMKSLASSFADQRARLEAGLGHGEHAGNTEDLRMALRGYRSFFQRLLSL